MSFLRPRRPAFSRVSFLLVVFTYYLLGTGFDLGARAQSLGLPHDCANSSYSWMYNTAGDPPCVLATDLLRPCGDLINGPELLNSPCVCNSVLYSLDSACRWCSNEPDTILTFSDFADSFSCTSTVEGQFPETIPPGTPIPSWAYLPLTGNQFDVAGAERMMLSLDPTGSEGNPAPPDDSTGTSTTTSKGSTSSSTLVTQHTPSTGTSTQHTTSTASPAPVSESTPSDTSGANSSHNHTTTNSHPDTGSASSNATTTSSGSSTTSNQRSTPSSYPTATNGSNEPSPLAGVPTVAGNASTTTPTGGPGKHSSNHLAAIIGGVVGGVCAVAILVMLGLFLVRRRRRRRHDDGAGPGIQRRLSRRKHGLPFGPQHETSVTQQMWSDDKGASTVVFKLYNPDDPSTYPPPLSEIHSDSKLSTYPGGYLEISGDAVKV
ncbi:hypothetical protein C8Q73DRAFT_505165 [Cubamyces lactineus]|nr:hypothetical protein C8Q73DRAFT_505165 [Cubamyces lactineus]